MTPAKPRIFYGYVIVLLATLIMVVTWGSFYSFGVFFKPVLEEFGWSRAATSIGYSLGFTLSGLFGIFTGRLSDRISPRIIVSVCSLLIGAGYLLTSQISAVWQLYLFYGLVGVGSSGAYIPSIAAVSRWFTKRRGLMTGISMAGIGLGTMVMSPLANWLISSYGWRTSYLVVGTLALVLLLVLAQFIKQEPAAMGLKPYGEDGTLPEFNNYKTDFSFSRAVRTRQFWMLCLMFTFVEYSVHNINVHIVPHVTDLGLSAALAAQVLAIIGALSLTSRIIMGNVGDRISNKFAAIAGFAIMLLALVWLLFSRGEWMVVVFAVGFGFGYGSYQPIISLLVAELFGLKSLGTILGLITFIIMAGASVGPILAGKIFDLTRSYQTAFLVCIGLGVIAIVIALLLKPTDKTKTEGT